MEDVHHVMDPVEAKVVVLKSNDHFKKTEFLYTSDHEGENSTSHWPYRTIDCYFSEFTSSPHFSTSSIIGYSICEEICKASASSPSNCFAQCCHSAVWFAVGRQEAVMKLCVSSLFMVPPAFRMFLLMYQLKTLFPFVAVICSRLFDMRVSLDPGETRQK